jgi:hypothetical protein
MPELLNRHITSLFCVGLIQFGVQVSLIFSLFNDAVNKSEYITSNG